MARQFSKYQSIGYARQTALNTENETDGDFVYFPAAYLLPEVAQDIFDLEIASGQVAAKYTPVVGVKKPVVKLKMQAFGFVKGYDPETQEPGVTAAIVSAVQVFLGLLLGSASDSATTAALLARGVGLSICDFTASKGATFGNNDVTVVASTTTAEVGAGNGVDYKAGQLFAAGSSKTDDEQTLTWIQSITADTLTFADAAGNQPVAGDDTWATVVAFTSSQQPQPLSIRLLGDNAAFKTVLIGATPVKATISGVAGKPPEIEIEFTCASIYQYSTGGGLQPMTIAPSLPYPLVGTGAGRLTFAAIGSAMAAKHGVQEFKITIENEMADVESHNMASGVSERNTADHKITLSCKIPRDSADTITSGENPWQVAQAAGTSYRLALYSGVLPGTLFSAYFPSIHQIGAPKPVEVNGMWYDELEFRPSAFTSDGGSTAPADTVMRLGWA